MLTNYLKIALRTLRRHRGYALINVVGLAFGLAASILILRYVQDEMSYDRFHEHADRVYRLTWTFLDENAAPQVELPLLDPPVAPLLQETYPEVAYAARLTPVGPLLSYRERHAEPEHTYWADPELFDILSFRFVAGEAALAEPFTLVLSQRTARALFGDQNPVGQAVRVNSGESFTVTGIFADLPDATHLPIDALGSMASLERWMGPLTWHSPNYLTYVLLDEAADPAALEAKLPPFLTDHLGPEAARTGRLGLQRLTDIHLHSHLGWEVTPNGNAAYVYLFSAIALFILLIACINFTNLATARSERRAKEVGVRKVAGAGRPELIRQFLTESVVMVGLALVLAAILVEAAVPLLRRWTGQELGLPAGGLATYVLLLLGIGAVVGLAAGSYPAFYLSHFRPAAVLKGPRRRGDGRSRLRSALVVTQFAIAIALMAATVVVYRQLAFVRDRPLGFDQEHVLILPELRSIASDFAPFRNRLLQHPDVVSVAQSNPVPFRTLGFVEDAQAAAGRSGQLSTASLFPVRADAHFFPTYRIDFAAGRNFSEDVASDATEAFVLNETAVEQLGWASPREAVGQRLTLVGRQGRVVGVVQDFHFESLHQKIAPMAFFVEPHNYRMVSVRVRPGADLPALLDFLEDRWQEHLPNRPLDYTFLDDQFGAVYAADQQLGRLFSAFALLAGLITSLGLLGLVSYTTEQRTKEIGVRKVLGASVADVVALLSKELVILVGIAFVVAAPVAFLAMTRWLGDFAYRTDLSGWTFVGVGLLALAAALLTVSYQTIRAALADPIESLRYE